MIKQIDPNMPSLFNVALVGVGKMGMLHAQAFQALPNVELIGALDTDPARKILIAGLGMNSVAKIDDLLVRPDAVIVATPSDSHARVAIPLLEQGIHCLVEKPLALTETEAYSMTLAAAKSGAVLAVGHSERFNWRLQQALKPLAEDELIVEVVRNSRPAFFQTQVDVVQDLMVHDIDWILCHEGSPVRAVKVYPPVTDGTAIREVCCRLTFDTRTYELSASHLNGQKERKIRVSRSGGTVLEFDLKNYKLPDVLDPLEKQAIDFINYCKGNPSKVSTGTHALDVLALVENVRRLCHEHQSTI